MTNHVVLVDDTDREVGSMEKMQAHVEGRLHRAFSIFIFNGEGEMLIQQRAAKKYHTGLLWSNACCSHPMPGESMDQALQRKLKQEMGFKCPLKPAFSFKYRAELDNGLTEHEIDHVYIGEYSGDLFPNPEEVADWKFLNFNDLNDDLLEHPERYTPWFRMLISPVSAHLSQTIQ